MKLKNQISMKYLAKLSILGEDNAFLAMQLRKNSDANRNYELTARTSRRRYSKMLEDSNINSMIKNAIKLFKLIPDYIMHMPFKYLIYPIGKGKFLGLKNNLPNTVKVLDVVKYINGLSDCPHKSIADMSNFKSQAIASIGFHSMTYLKTMYTVTDPCNEKETLDYIFPTSLSKLDIENTLRIILPYKYRGLSNLNEKTIGYHPMQKISVDLLKTFEKWSSVSFKQIEQEMTFLPRFIENKENFISISDEGFSNNLKYLSVYVLSAISNRTNIIKKINMLYRFDIRNVSDLLLFSKKYQFIGEKQLINILINYHSNLTN